jgi:hypothetical protein
MIFLSDTYPPAPRNPAGLPSGSSVDGSHGPPAGHVDPRPGTGEGAAGS